jgi:hypothetical protein
MKFLRSITRFGHSLFIFLSVASHALESQVKQLVKWETEGNAVSKRSSAPIAIQHYEIPLSKLEKNFAKNLDPQIRAALIFSKDGEDYVRWVINPEDTKWHLELQRWLVRQNLDPNPKSYFKAYLTASRSLIVEDPKTKVAFSVKVSTNQTGGMWKDKKQPIDDARQIRMVSDYVMDVSERVHFDHIVFMDEPLQLGVKELDQALIVRNLGELNSKSKKRYYLPGFSAVHDKVGREIALKNGSVNPIQFWNEHYNKPLARALAELSAHFGITYDSPHSQNFLIELDENMRPTGRIVLRDFGDAYISREWFQALGHDDFIKKWEAENIIDGYLHSAVGIMHGNHYPSWMNDAAYIDWGRDFYETYDQEFSKITGIPLETLQRTQINLKGRYFSKDYSLRGRAWKEYLRRAPCFHGMTMGAGGLECPDFIKSKWLPKTSQAHCSTQLRELVRAVSP